MNAVLLSLVACFLALHLISACLYLYAANSFSCNKVVSLTCFNHLLTFFHATSEFFLSQVLTKASAFRALCDFKVFFQEWCLEKRSWVWFTVAIRV